MSISIMAGSRKPFSCAKAARHTVTSRFGDSVFVVARSCGIWADNLPQQGNNDVVEYKLTRKLKDKIVAYMIVLALHVDGFSVEYEVIAKDLKYVAHGWKYSWASPVGT